MTPALRQWLHTLVKAAIDERPAGFVSDDDVSRWLDAYISQQGPPPLSTATNKRGTYKMEKGGPQKALRQMHYCRKCKSTPCKCLPRES